MADKDAPEPGHLLLRARPVAVSQLGPRGQLKLGLGGDRDGLLYVPERYSPAAPMPLAVMLHGAGGSAARVFDGLIALAEQRGVILLAPDSRGRTWDVLLGGYGPDVAFIDQALKFVFGRYAVNQATLAIGGFSDGASYALSLGLMNGDLFSHIVALSPGFSAPALRRGEPRIFISHGTADTVLPIDRCGRRLSRLFIAEGYAVRYEEFEGPHTVPPAIGRAAFDWLLGA
jgi:phospholipase/carboxylesterase